MGDTLAPGEQPGALVCGRIREWPTAVLRTERRLLLVVDRPGRPVIESLHPEATEVVVRSAGGVSSTVLLFDRGRMLEITVTGDPAAAEALVLRPALAD